MPQHWISGVFFARGVSPCQKWWWSLLGREISCSQWEGPSMHSRCLVFFPFMFWGGGGRRDFFSFFPTSQCVRTMFLSSSQWVPNIFPNIFSIPPHFYMPWKMVSAFHLNRWAKGEELSSSKESLLFWGVSIISFFLGVMD